MGDGQECQICRRSLLNCDCETAVDDVLLRLGDIRTMFREDRVNMKEYVFSQGPKYAQGWSECFVHLMITLQSAGESQATWLSFEDSESKFSSGDIVVRRWPLREVNQYNYDLMIWHDKSFAVWGFDASSRFLRIA